MNKNDKKCALKDPPPPLSGSDGGPERDDADPAGSAATLVLVLVGLVLRTTLLALHKCTAPLPGLTRRGERQTHFRCLSAVKCPGILPAGSVPAELFQSTFLITK